MAGTRRIARADYWRDHGSPVIILQVAKTQLQKHTCDYL